MLKRQVEVLYTRTCNNTSTIESRRVDSNAIVIGSIQVTLAHAHSLRRWTLGPLNYLTMLLVLQGQTSRCIGAAYLHIRTDSSFTSFDVSPCVFERTRSAGGPTRGGVKRTTLLLCANAVGVLDSTYPLPDPLLAIRALTRGAASMHKGLLPSK